MGLSLPWGSQKVEYPAAKHAAEVAMFCVPAGGQLGQLKEPVGQLVLNLGSENAESC